MKTYVTDGKQVFHNYYWNRKGQIVNVKTKKVINGYTNNFGLKVVKFINDQGKTIGRSFEKLKKFSHKKKHLPKNYDKYVDVFGFENLYCFDPKDPTKIFSKTFLTFKKILSNRDGYQFIRVGKGTLYLHIMVYESLNKMKIDKSKYQIHHISGNNRQNNIQNLMLVSCKQHKKIHNQSRKAKNETKSTHN